MKLAALYTLFNGEELLLGSIKQIYNYVDCILICWQDISNKGNHNPGLIPFLEKINDPKIILRQYIPNLSLNTKANERMKYDMMLNWAKSINATNFIVLAADHYYKPYEFKLYSIAAQHCDVTLTRMYTYYKHPQWQLTPPEDYYCPFVCKLYPNTQSDPKPYLYLVDPSARINTRKEVMILPFMVHHYSMVRKDIVNKFDNAAASVNWKQDKVEQFKNEFANAIPGNAITYFKGRKIKEVSNYFNISI